MEYKFTGTGLENKEKRWAKQRFEDYREANHFERLSDLQLLEELVLKEAWQERYKKQVEQLGTQIATAAMKYDMLKYTTNQEITFKIEDALSFEGNTGPYLQYALVRSKKILKNA